MPNPPPRPQASSDASRPDLIVVSNVSRVIGPEFTGVQILDDVSFTVPAATLFAINGPSGCGKSTLLNLLTGIDHPARGGIVFDGKSIQARSENAGSTAPPSPESYLHQRGRCLRRVERASAKSSPGGSPGTAAHPNHVGPWRRAISSRSSFRR